MIEVGAAIAAGTAASLVPDIIDQPIMTLCAPWSPLCCLPSACTGLWGAGTGSWAC